MPDDVHDLRSPASQPLMVLEEALMLHAPAASSSSSESASLITEECNDDSDDSAVDMPGCLCSIPLTAENRRCCMFNSCLRPFCAVNASCTRFVCVNELLVYCSMQCARQDGKQLPSQRLLGDSSLSQPVSSHAVSTAVSKPTTYNNRCQTPAPSCRSCQRRCSRGAVPVSERQPRSSVLRDGVSSITDSRRATDAASSYCCAAS